MNIDIEKLQRLIEESASIGRLKIDLVKECELKPVDCNRCKWDGLSHLSTELRTCDRCIINPNFKVNFESKPEKKDFKNEY